MKIKIFCRCSYFSLPGRAKDLSAPLYIDILQGQGKLYISVNMCTINVNISVNIASHFTVSYVDSLNKRTRQGNKIRARKSAKQTL